MSKAAPPVYLPIKDYALIGNCHSAALVAKSGAVDWLCWPRFDSPSFFAALLDAEKGGCFRVAPAHAHTAERRYLDGTNVLETTFTTDRGVLRVTDLMPVAPLEGGGVGPKSSHRLLRRLECVRGTVEVNVHCAPRPDYARTQPHLHRHSERSYMFADENGPVAALRSDAPLPLSAEAGAVRGTLALEEGAAQFLDFAFLDGRPPGDAPLQHEQARQTLQQTVRYWQDWSAQCAYDGPYRTAVVRSVLTLKLMTYAATGALVAAPTTSLPEQIGGARNWDYRYCWLRDASLTLRALSETGYPDEEAAFFKWLVQAAHASMPEKFGVLYDVTGQEPPEEQTLEHLGGYRGSTPVRVGNGAKGQLQLDMYGEIVRAAYEYVQRGRTLTEDEEELLGWIGETVCARWTEPDEGIWEIRAERRHHTYSKAMSWVALDRLLWLHRQDHVQIDAEHFETVRADIRRAVEEQGYSEALGSYAATFGGNMVDASLLLMATAGYADPAGPRMKATWQNVQDRLGAGSLLYRYRQRHEHDDGLPAGEGAFGICGFWAVDYLVLAGQTDEAQQRFEDLLGYANDVGLFSEEIDPESGAALGNFPQAFTHVGLIGAALRLKESAIEAPAT